MKKIIAIAISVVLMLSLFPTVAIAGNCHGYGANAFDVNGARYNLNLIGKKSDWNEISGFINPHRRTIFIPEDTTGFRYTASDGTAILDSIKLEIGLDKNADDIYVTHRTTFDSDGIGIMMPDKKYYVFIASKGKHNKRKRKY